MPSGTGVHVDVSAVMLDALEIVQRPKKFFLTPHISQPPDFQSKNLSKIFQLISTYTRVYTVVCCELVSMMSVKMTVCEHVELKVMMKT